MISNAQHREPASRANGKRVPDGLRPSGEALQSRSVQNGRWIQRLQQLLLVEYLISRMTASLHFQRRQGVAARRSRLTGTSSALRHRFLVLTPTKEIPPPPRTTKRASPRPHPPPAPARLYGATGAPSSWAQWEQLLAQTAPGLEDSSILGEFLQIMENAPIVPRALRPVQRMLVRAAVDMTPQPVRSFASLRGHGLGPGQRALVGGLGRVARWMPWPGLPPAQARARMRAPPPG